MRRQVWTLQELTNLARALSLSQSPDERRGMAMLLVACGVGLQDLADLAQAGQMQAPTVTSPGIVPRATAVKCYILSRACFHIRVRYGIMRAYKQKRAETFAGRLARSVSIVATCGRLVVSL